MSYFNVRVYGLLINDQQEVLISDEQQEGRRFTKFPGGGLEFGEGLIDALKREFIEECALEVEVLKHFYTTDFYEKSSFNDSQILSIYYIVKAIGQVDLPFKSIPVDFTDNTSQAFRWIKLDTLTEADVTFRTDKTVVTLLKQAL